MASLLELTVSFFPSYSHWVLSPAALTFFQFAFNLQIILVETCACLLRSRRHNSTLDAESRCAAAQLRRQLESVESRT